MKATYPKIGLLTPYTGGNLGDGAIQDAVIHQLRQRLPDAAICLITLAPEATEKLHQVPCYPVNATPIGGPAMPPRTTWRPAHDRPTKGLGRYATLKDKVKQSRYCPPFLKPTYRLLKLSANAMPRLCREIRHIVNSYRILRDSDFLIASGGGQIDDYWGGSMGHPYALFKWGLLAKLADAKFMCLSVGVCNIEGLLSRLLIRNALKYASYRSYRDQRSKDMLSELPFTRNDTIYPDLAFSYPVASSIHRRPRDGARSRVLVGISPIAYLSEFGWPRKNPPVFEAYLSTLIAFTKGLVRKGHSVVLFSTELLDREVIKMMFESLAHEVGRAARSDMRIAESATVRDVLKELSPVDYVIASRLHGAILAHLLCKPVTAISYDRKVRDYMAAMEQEQYCCDIHRTRVVDLEKMFEAMIANRSSIEGTLHRRVEESGELLQQQYDALFCEERSRKSCPFMGGVNS